MSIGGGSNYDLLSSIEKAIWNIYNSILLSANPNVPKRKVVFIVSIDKNSPNKYNDAQLKSIATELQGFAESKFGAGYVIVEVSVVL